MGHATSDRRFALSRTPVLAVALALAIVTLASFSPVLNNGFISFDDPAYITENPQVRAGLSWAGLRWAFVSTEAANWHPLTWLAHMTDVQLFGLRPAGHHVTNLLLHLGNALLLLAILRRGTGALWPSTFVAALFALHPLHVESVAWAAEKKDVLCSFFWLLAIVAYLRYARRPSPGRYAAVLGAFVLGLLAKPMATSLPVVLLLLDFWPLGRFRWEASAAVPGGRFARPRPLGLAVEKFPLLLLSAGSIAISYYAQSRGGSVSQAFALRETLGTTLPNVPLSYFGYLVKTFWPTGLAVFYPHPGHGVPAARLAASLLVLAAITTLALWRFRRAPALACGWFWYLVTLAPAVGFLQVGSQAMADRYTYLPLIGIFIALAWGVPPLLPGGWWPGTLRGGGAALVVGTLAVATFFQVARWRNDITLFSHAAAVTSGNWVAENILGKQYRERQEYVAAAAHYAASLRYRPYEPSSLFFYGLVLQSLGRTEEALAQFRTLGEIRPEGHEAFYNMGVLLLQQGRHAEAAAAFRRVLVLKPDSATARALLERCLRGTPGAGPGNEKPPFPL